MNKIYLIFVSVLFFMHIVFVPSYGQAPAGIEYQAVVTDPAGEILSVQDITLRVTVLKGSATGNEEWIETHDVTTDEFGLFKVIVGEGTSVGGSQAAFSDIVWNDDKYFLECEIKLTSTADYEVIAIQQIMSVPYALHANTADSALNDADTDPANEIQSLDYNLETSELSLVNPDGSVGSSISLDDGTLNSLGASIEFPQGIRGTYIVAPDAYQVPVGKTFYILSAPIEIKLPNYIGDVNDLHIHSTKPGLPVFPSGTNIEECGCTGFLVDNDDSFIEIVILDFGPENGQIQSYSVPTGKVLFLKSGFVEQGVQRMNVNSGAVELSRPANVRTIILPAFPGGSVISPAGTDPNRIFTGFLISGISE